MEQREYDSMTEELKELVQADKAKSLNALKAELGGETEIVLLRRRMEKLKAECQKGSTKGK